MPTVFDSDGKAAYVYNAADDTRYQEWYNKYPCKA